MADDQIAVKVQNLSKSFKIPIEASNGVKQKLVNILKGRKGYREFTTLNDISFEIEKGDFFGIVGRNGSGKSTLLKTIAGIYSPNKGSVQVNGTLVPFIELGVGFNPELSGRENVYLNGALLGFSHDEMDDMYEDIVDFAELYEFMEERLKNYSSGMQVRLAFSIAIRAKGDILVLDEVLAVGDEAFQRKCNNFFDQIKQDKSKTIILVTHSMGSVKKYCNKAIIINNGKIILSGNPEDVANQYSEENLSSGGPKKRASGLSVGLNEIVPLLKVTSVSHRIVSSEEKFKFKIDYDYRDKTDVYIAFSILDTGRGGITYDSGSIKVKPGRNAVSFEVPMGMFNSSEFKIVSSVRVKEDDDADETEMIAFTNEDNSLFFSVRNKKEASNYALLSDDSFIIKQIDEQGM